MAARSNDLVSALASVVRLHPRLSAGLAFELGVMVGAFVKTARGRGGLTGASAKLIEAVPLLSSSMQKTRKPAARKRGPARRTKRAARH